MYMQSKIEQRVMASVGVIYGVKQLVSATAIKLYVLVASVWTLGALVWVARVEQNFMTALHGGLPKVLPYMEVALTHTSLYVQLALIVAAVAGISFLLDIVRGLTSRQTSFA
jgi:hypothetical protein